MSSFLDNVGQYLDAQNASLTFNNAAGRNVFTGELPADPDDCVVLLGLPGSTITDSRDVKELEFPRFQVVTRAVDYEDAATLLSTVRSTLHGLIGTSFEDYRVLRLHAEQDGGPLGQDDKGRFEFSINFIAEYHATE